MSTSTHTPPPTTPDASNNYDPMNVSMEDETSVDQTAAILKYLRDTNHSYTTSSSSPTHTHPPLIYHSQGPLSKTRSLGLKIDPRSPRPQQPSPVLTVRFGGDAPGMHYMTGPLAAASFAPDIKVDSMESMGLVDHDAKKVVNPAGRSVSSRMATSLEKTLLQARQNGDSDD
jgi:hypothetical protein